MTLDNLEIEREDIGKKVYRITKYYLVEKTFRVLAKDEDEAWDKTLEHVKIDWDKVKITGFDSDVQYHSGDSDYTSHEITCDGEILEQDFDKDLPEYYDNDKMKSGD
jgi:hypothetical protein